MSRRKVSWIIFPSSVARRQGCAVTDERGVNEVSRRSLQHNDIITYKLFPHWSFLREIYGPDGFPSQRPSNAETFGVFFVVSCIIEPVDYPRKGLVMRKAFTYDVTCVLSELYTDWEHTDIHLREIIGYVEIIGVKYDFCSINSRNIS